MIIEITEENPQQNKGNCSHCGLPITGGYVTKNGNVKVHYNCERSYDQANS